jgi:hypothetical protein
VSDVLHLDKMECVIAVAILRCIVMYPSNFVVLSHAVAVDPEILLLVHDDDVVGPTAVAVQARYHLVHVRPWRCHRVNDGNVVAQKCRNRVSFCDPHVRGHDHALHFEPQQRAALDLHRICLAFEVDIFAVAHRCRKVVVPFAVDPEPS